MNTSVEGTRSVVVDGLFDRTLDNPYVSLLVSSVTAEGFRVSGGGVKAALDQRPDIVHLHWPTNHFNRPTRIQSIVASIKLIAALTYLKIQGCHIMWTIHNISPHECKFPVLYRMFLRSFFRLVDGYFVLSRSGGELVRKKMPGLARKPAFYIPHGDYRSVYPDSCNQEAAKKQLNINEGNVVLLFFGAIRPYKNVAHLVRTFSALRRPNVTLIVAGACRDEGTEREIRELAQASSNSVCLHLRRIPAAEIGLFFGAADGVVLPFKEVFNSGSLMLSLSLNCRVLIPRTEVFEEVAENVGKEWVDFYDGELRAADLGHFISRTVPSSKGMTPDLGEYAWNGIGRATADAYREILSRSERYRRR